MRYGRPIRLAPAAYANRDAVFHLTVRTHPEVGSLPEVIRDAIWASLMAERDEPAVGLHLAVLMPDHIHLVASPDEMDIVSWLGRWKSLSRRATWEVGHRGVVWKRRFHDRALRGQDAFDAAADYILRNPSAAGLVADDDLWAHRWAEWFDA